LVTSTESAANSWWASSSRYSVECSPLTADLETEVAIIGGGFTGLSAAYHLQRAGVACAVLEAHQVGWGASGRNGGMVVPRYKRTYAELEKGYGEATARQLYWLAHEALKTLEDIVQDHGLSCDYRRTGHLTPIDNEVDRARFEADIDWLRLRPRDRVPRLLDAAETAKKCGTSHYRAAYLDQRGVSIHPLEYAQSLAGALAAGGVAIHGQTPVLRWEATDTGVRVETPRGCVRARQLVLATNGYTDLTPAGDEVRRRVVPVASAVIATEPLPEALRAVILPDGESATDAKRLTNYYRVLRDGSLLFGGRGGEAAHASARHFERLRRDMLNLFPQLHDIELTHRWYGLVAVTLDSLPHIGSLNARVHYGLGYNGRGVLLATLFGRQLASLAMGEGQPALGPMNEGRFVPIPFHALRVPAKKLALTWLQFVDSLHRNQGNRGHLA
jgi:gamma-glutamylputrescine oxidase